MGYPNTASRQMILYRRESSKGCVHWGTLGKYLRVSPAPLVRSPWSASLVFTQQRGKPKGGKKEMVFGESC